MAGPGQAGTHAVSATSRSPRSRDGRRRFRPTPWHSEAATGARSSWRARRPERGTGSPRGCRWSPSIAVTPSASWTRGCSSGCGA